MVTVRGLAPFAACRSGKTGFLKEIPFAVESETWVEQEGLQNTGEKVVSWGSGSKYGGSSEQRLLLWEWFLFLLSKAHRD